MQIAFGRVCRKTAPTGPGNRLLERLLKIRVICELDKSVIVVSYQSSDG